MALPKFCYKWFSSCLESTSNPPEEQSTSFMTTKSKATPSGNSIIKDVNSLRKAILNESAFVEQDATPARIVDL
jgi:hypothetical protein